MSAVFLIANNVAVGMETWLCYVFCSVFLDIDYFKKRKLSFMVMAFVSVLVIGGGDLVLPRTVVRSLLYSVLIFYR